MLRTKSILLAAAFAAFFTLAHADDISDLKAAVAQLKADVAALKTLTANQQTMLNNLGPSLNALVTKTQFITVGGKTMFIRGCNVQITSADKPEFPNGLGNLIIGWNNARMDGKDVRTGSHFLVMGAYNNYSGQSGIVNGGWNDAGQNTVILNGYRNVATGNDSVILTGANNVNKGMYGLMGTGYTNVLSQYSKYSTILSGKANGGYGNYGVTLTGYSGGDSSGRSYQLIATGEDNSCDGGSACAILTGAGNNFWCGGGHNLIGTGYKNSIQKTAEGCFIADGNQFVIDYDGRTNETKDWKYRLMSEGYLFDPSH